MGKIERIGNALSLRGEPVPVAKPFVKWAGGKARLADQILHAFPRDFGERDSLYLEPFVGGGAVLFRVLQAFPQVRAVINDINPALVATWRVVRDNVGELIDELRELEALYLRSRDRRAFFLERREEFNAPPPQGHFRAADFSQQNVL